MPCRITSDRVSSTSIVFSLYFSYERIAQLQYLFQLCFLALALGLEPDQVNPLLGQPIHGIEGDIA